MVVGRNNGVVGLTGFSDKKMSGLLFGPQESGRNNGVVVRRGSTVLDSKTLFHCEFLKVYLQYMKYHEKQPSCCIQFQFYPASS